MLSYKEKVQKTRNNSRYERLPGGRIYPIPLGSES